MEIRFSKWGSFGSATSVCRLFAFLQIEVRLGAQFVVYGLFVDAFLQMEVRLVVQSVVYRLFGGVFLQMEVRLVVQSHYVVVECVSPNRSSLGDIVPAALSAVA